MAAKKKAASAADADKIIVAFALRDYVEGEGDDAVAITEGQRLELQQEEFDGLAKDGICAQGVFVKMKTAVEGGRYSLKPHDTTWLAPHVYEAWKTAGYCEPTDDDPQVGAVLKAREDALREAIMQRDALSDCLKDEHERIDELEANLRGFVVWANQAKASAVTAMDAVMEILKTDTQSRDAVAAELQKLINMLPDQIEGAGDGSEPELNLS